MSTAEAPKPEDPTTPAEAIEGSGPKGSSLRALTIADRGYVIVHGHIAFAGNSAAELNDNELIKKFYMGL